MCARFFSVTHISPPSTSFQHPTPPIFLVAVPNQAGGPSYRYRICKHMICRPGVTYRNMICMITLWTNNIKLTPVTRAKTPLAIFTTIVVNYNYENCRALRKHLYCSHDLFSWDFSSFFFFLSTYMMENYGGKTTQSMF